MLQLTPVEDLTLRALRYACRPLLVRVLLWMTVALCLYWVIQRIMGLDGVQGNDLTLYNPGKLHDTLTFFALPPAQSNTTQNQRHKTEHLCRQLLEAMLKMKLPKVRPKWLMNPTTKRCLELDMYNEAHHLAFEYDGAQHKVFTPHYHANEHHFEYRKLLDKLKDELCREANVKLIRIPWSDVSYGDEVRTARFLEHLLYTNGIPYRSVISVAP